MSKQQESEILEYKESLAEKENAGRDICAFSNKSGGTLYFGIKNDGTANGLHAIWNVQSLGMALTCGSFLKSQFQLRNLAS